MDGHRSAFFLHKMKNAPGQQKQRGCHNGKTEMPMIRRGRKGGKIQPPVGHEGQKHEKNRAKKKAQTHSRRKQQANFSVAGGNPVNQADPF